MVAGGHIPEAPAIITYASVMSRDRIQIITTMASLNDLQVKVGYIKNDYLTAPVTEKIWTRPRKEFGSDCGEKAVIVRDLYVLKSAGASFSNHLADYMQEMGYK